MASYDSDSSEHEYTETGVLLGYADKEADGDTISRLGGHPEWLTPDKPPSAALARCKVCKDVMALLLQLNGELPEQFPGHERRLYVFSCRRTSCRRKKGSVRVIRAVRVSKDAMEVEPKAEEVKVEETKKAEEKPSINLGQALFGGTGLGASAPANPFSTGSANPFSTPSSASNPFSQAAKPPPAPETQPPVITLTKTFAQTLSLNNTQPPVSEPQPYEPWPTDGPSLQKAYPISYLPDAEYETLDPTPAKLPASARLITTDDEDPTKGDKAEKADPETFESSMDSTFQKFADRVAQNPDQAIRYEFAGAPLLYSRDDEVGRLLSGGGGIPGCGNCGAARVFEVQLMPQAITELEAEELGLEGMDWGTAIVGVCGADCQERGVETGGDGYIEEWVGVQWEEIMNRG